MGARISAEIGLGTERSAVAGEDVGLVVIGDAGSRVGDTVGCGVGSGVATITGNGVGFPVSTRLGDGVGSGALLQESGGNLLMSQICCSI